MILLQYEAEVKSNAEQEARQQEEEYYNQLDEQLAQEEQKKQEEALKVKQHEQFEKDHAEVEGHIQEAIGDIENQQVEEYYRSLEEAEGIKPQESAQIPQSGEIESSNTNVPIEDNKPLETSIKNDSTMTTDGNQNPINEFIEEINPSIEESAPTSAPQTDTEVESGKEVLEDTPSKELTDQENKLSEYIKKNKISANPVTQKIELLRMEMIEEQAEYLKATGNQGIDQGYLTIDEQGNVIDRVGRMSKNPPWYREWYGEKGVAPTPNQYLQLAEKHLKEGFDDHDGFVPSNDEFLELEGLLNGLRRTQESESASPKEGIKNVKVDTAGKGNVEDNEGKENQVEKTKTPLNEEEQIRSEIVATLKENTAFINFLKANKREDLEHSFVKKAIKDAILDHHTKLMRLKVLGKMLTSDYIKGIKETIYNDIISNIEGGKEVSENVSNNDIPKKGHGGTAVSQGHRGDKRNGGHNNSKSNGKVSRTDEEELQDADVPNVDIQSDKDSNKRGDTDAIPSNENDESGNIRAEHDETKDHSERDTKGSGKDSERDSTRVEDRELEKKTPKYKNYQIKDNDSVFTSGGKKTRFKANAKAIKTLIKVLKEERTATPEEQNVLAQFSGWGALPEAFDYTGWGSNLKPKHANWEKEFYEIKELFEQLQEYIPTKDYKTLYDQAKESTMNAHFTSPTVISNMYSILGKLGFKKGSILEPSMGIGNFFGLLPKNLSNKTRLYGVEMESVTGNIAKLLYPNADIRIQGYQKSIFPNDCFDVAIGNVPFGDIRVHDDNYKHHYLKDKIHNYFFAKSIDKVKPKGIMMFITSTGTMDSQGQHFRGYMSTKAKLIAAIRLPNNAFKNNAGTEVTSDVLIFQKLEDGEIPKNKDWVTTDKVNVNGKEIKINKYFKDNPHMVLGELTEDTLYGGDRIAVVDKEGNFEEKFKELIEKHIPESIIDTKQSTPKPIILPFEETKEIKEGAYTKKGNSVFKKEKGKVVPVTTDKAQIAAVIDIKELAKKVINMQTLTDVTEKDLESKRKELKKVYESYVKKHGHLLKRDRKVTNGSVSFSAKTSVEKLLKGDPELYIFKGLELEKIKDGEQIVTPSQIFDKRTYTPYKAIGKVGNAADGLVASLNDLGYADIPHISKIYGKSEKEVIKELGNKIYKNPITDEWETEDEYLSGNVKTKLKAAKERAGLDEEYERNVKALEKVQPEDLPISKIEMRMGESWIPAKYQKEAICSLLDVTGYNKNNIKLEYGATDAKWSLNQKAGLDQTVAMQKLIVDGRVSALEVVRKALNNGDVKIYDKIHNGDTEVKVFNKAKTTELRQKVEKVSAYFKEWVMKNPEAAAEVAKIYNEKFRNLVPRQYDGSFLKFPNMNPIFQKGFYEHQRNGVARAIFNGNTLFAHAVGSGKTYEEIAAVMEYKRLGLASKPVMVVPNNKLGDYEKDFRELYPSAKILALSEDDFNTQNIKQTLIQSATNDWDCIIIRHSSFTKIPVGSDTPLYK
ncbi:Eco57I restriction-modification methylase domain-containing protein [Marinisporobacter balticus]|uniref:N12 class adenine-specific DNA methylase n=1 Tax=Marinisporobacter balticus TaxID=2018667 RepID=A0A4R2L1R3_9FIRM|nr:hypothetical protein [Marinisporobacter balticus]TCO79137.1 N12 class adenine-specific DNA methylase [Marinisporobacter balticus]